MASIKGIWCFRDNINFEAANVWGDGSATTREVSFSFVSNSSRAFTRMVIYPLYGQVMFKSDDDGFELLVYTEVDTSGSGTTGWYIESNRFINIDYKTSYPETDIFYKWFLTNAVYVTDHVEPTVSGNWRFNNTLVKVDMSVPITGFLSRDSSVNVTAIYPVSGDYSGDIGLCYSINTSGDLRWPYYYASNSWSEDKYRYITIAEVQEVTPVQYCWLLMNAVNIDPGYVSGEYQFKRGVDTIDEEAGVVLEVKGLPSFTVKSGQQYTALKLEVDQYSNIDFIYYYDGSSWTKVYSRGWEDHQLDRVIDFGETPKYIADGEVYAWLMANTIKVTKKLYTENCIAEIAEAVRELTGSVDLYSVYNLAEAVRKYIKYQL